MHYVGWMVAMLSVGLLYVPETRWAVAVLVAGPILLLVLLRGAMPSLRRPAPASGPRSIDIEARHIRDLQESIDERTPAMKDDGHDH